MCSTLLSGPGTRGPVECVVVVISTSRAVRCRNESYLKEYDSCTYRTPSCYGAHTWPQSCGRTREDCHVQDDSQVHEIRIEFDVPVPMRDGTVLRADVYRPAAEGAYPVLVTRHPYDKSAASMLDAFLDVKKIVRAGYIVVHQDSRGRFESDGDWLPWKYEREDGYDTAEWAASLPNSNGKVGMFGGSYLGSTQWSTAISKAPHLAAIAPAITWSDPDDGLMFRGGAIELGLNTWWGLFTALGQIPKSGLAPDDVMKTLQASLTAFDLLATQTYHQLPSGAVRALEASGQPDIGVARALADPATTDDSRVANRYDEIDIPSLTFAGWYDVFLQGSLDNFVGMHNRGRTARLVVGPWTHLTIGSGSGQIGDVNFGISAGTINGHTMTEVQREWYDHWLKDLPATEAHESGVLLFVMGANQWRAETEWPLSRAVNADLYLHEDATLSWTKSEAPEAQSGFIYDPADPVITRGGNLVMSSEFPAGVFDQRDIESRDDVLVFTTAPLEEDIEITGRVNATLFVSTDGPSTDWVVRLCDVDEHGVSRNLVDGITRVHTEPGRIDEVAVDLWSTSILVKAGHRLRVHVTSSNFPRWDRNLNTGQPVTEGTTMRVANNRIFHDEHRPSRIILPVVKD
ncbi:CocE/NonD family hydrolase [Gordonia terrae]|uniref:CocE/NonD family hydrolase n=1 Tax=Gordonia terrae TaxID=2055 RepID=UPI003F6BA40D